jgi:replicative DNA helicase
MGKSSLAFQCNEHQALEQELRVGVWALEMSGEQMFARRNCHKIGKAWMDVRSGHVTHEEEERLKQYVLEYAEQLDGHLYVNDNTSTTCADIVRIQQREKFDVLMIDHLGLLKDRKFSGERHDQYLGRLTEQLHSLAKDTHSVVLLLAQLNRGVEQRTDKRPHMGDLRDSGNIEQNADNVALLYGDWYYDKTAEPYTEIIMGKFRDGVKDRSAFVEFDMAMQEFKSVAVMEIDEASAEEMERTYDTEGGQMQYNLQDEIPF